MKERKYLILLLLFMPLAMLATKIDKNTSKAMLTVTSYDKNGKIIRSGCGFYISPDGYALSTYDIFKNAHRAEVTDSKGKKAKVIRICGANSLYNIVRFRTESTDVSTLTLANDKMTKNDAATLISNNIKILPAVTTVVTDISDIDSMKYYTLQKKVDNKYSGCPVLNSRGEVAAILQTNQNVKNTNSYALDIAFEKLLRTNGMSAAEIALNSIFIPKELPADEPQARTFIFFLTQNSKDTLTYLTAMEDYINAYPEQSFGYTQRATYYASLGKYAEADNDLKQGLTNATDKDNLHYEASKLIYRLNMIKGYQQYQDWDLNKAKAEAEEAYNFNQQPVFTLQKADCQFALKQYAEAFESYQEVNTSSISSPQTFGAAAISAEMAKMDSSIVLAMLDSAVNFYGTPHPKSVTMYLIQRATHLDKYGRYKEAAKDYQEVEDLSGTKNLNDNFFYLKSLCDTRARLYMRALTDIEKALSMKPDDYLYLVEKALAQWRMGNYDEAVYAGQKALKINPNGADAYKAIGLALGEQKKTAEAIKHLTKAKELGDPQAEALIQSLKDK